MSRRNCLGFVRGICVRKISKWGFVQGRKFSGGFLREEEMSGRVLGGFFAAAFLIIFFMGKCLSNVGELFRMGVQISCRIASLYRVAQKLAPFLYDLTLPN